MTDHRAIFPTFFMSGFECSTFRWKDGKRRNLTEEIQHGSHVDEDYELLAHLGIGVSREGIPWPLVDIAPGVYDFSCIDPMIEAMKRTRILPIWDLCHYGYPDDTDPFSEEFTPRFAAYCRAAAEYVIPKLPGPHCFTPINEITFFSFCGGEWGWAAPYRTSTEDRDRLRLLLCRAAIAGVNAIREIDQEARMVHADPLVRIAPPPDRPDLADEAYREETEDTFVAWDVLGGLRHPALGGAPEILDVVAANCYSFGQMEYREGEVPHVAMAPRDERIRPLCDLLEVAWNRYERPMIIAETSGLGEGRPGWLRDVMEESLAAVARGVDLQGICLFPAADMPNWHDGKWLHNGIYDLVEEEGDLRRVPYEPYVRELRRWQRLLNRATELDENPESDPIDLSEIAAAARRLQAQPDKDWS